MFTVFLLTMIGELLSMLANLIPPDFGGINLAHFRGEVVGWVNDLGDSIGEGMGFIPFRVIYTCVLLLLAAFVIALLIKLIRAIISHLTGGGGAT